MDTGHSNWLNPSQINIETAESRHNTGGGGAETTRSDKVNLRLRVPVSLSPSQSTKREDESTDWRCDH